MGLCVRQIRAHFFFFSWLSNSDVVRLPIEHCKPNWRPIFDYVMYTKYSVYSEKHGKQFVHTFAKQIFSHILVAAVIFSFCSLSFATSVAFFFRHFISNHILLLCVFFSLSSSNSGRYLGTQLKNSGGNKWTYWVHSSHTHRWQV